MIVVTKYLNFHVSLPLTIITIINDKAHDSILLFQILLF